MWEACSCGSSVFGAPSAISESMITSPEVRVPDRPGGQVSLLGKAEVESAAGKPPRGNRFIVVRLIGDGDVPIVPAASEKFEGDRVVVGSRLCEKALQVEPVGQADRIEMRHADDLAVSFVQGQRRASGPRRDSMLPRRFPPRIISTSLSETVMSQRSVTEALPPVLSVPPITVQKYSFSGKTAG